MLSLLPQLVFLLLAPVRLVTQRGEPGVLMKTGGSIFRAFVETQGYN